MPVPAMKGGSTYSSPTGDAYGMSSGLFNNASGQITNTANMNEAMMPFLMGDNIANGMSRYMNPYTENVVDMTMGDIDRQRQIALTQNAGDAATAGAFGGARHGLVEAQTNEAAMREMGRTSADLRRSGFMDSAVLSGADVSNRADAFNDYFGRAMAGTGAGIDLGKNFYNVGADVGQRQMQSGAMGQALSQGLLDAARGEFAGYANAPQDALNAYISALSGNPLSGATSTSGSSSYKPGALDYAGAGLSAAGNMLSFSPIKLK